MSVVIETTKGDITVDLYTNERPKTCLNFLKLCKQKMYNNNLFHMIQNNFIAQTGDPSETGRGGDSIFYHLYGDQARYFEAESNPRIKHTKQGQLSMVNCGENMLGSQFFFTLSEDLDYLDGEHCVFGEVVEGFDIVEVLNETICDSEHRPYQDVRITHMAVLHDPFDDPPGLEPRPDSPEPSKELLMSSRIGADENINDYAGKTEEEINEIIAGKEANARATILEMVGDLPDADCAPPENVLFVCKLNPVTNDDDLEIIFSRFGKVKCCEVIRDKKSGESLQYAFVEFEDENACESAYFKMDNVLIDDRRIHVDFSQSVAKFQWKGKGRLEVKDEKESKKSNVGEKDFKSNKDRDFNNRQKDQEKDIKRNRSENEKHTSISRDRYEKREDKHKHRYDREDDRKHHRNGHDKERRDERDIRDRKDEREYKDKREDRNQKDRREERDNRDRREEKDNKDKREERDNRDRKSERENSDRKDVRGERDREERNQRDRKDERDNRDKRAEREDDKGKERSSENSARSYDRGDLRDSTNGSRDKWDERKSNISKNNQRSEHGERKRDCKDDRDIVRNKDERVEKRKYPEERSKTKDKKKSKNSSSDASSSETDNKRRHKKAKKKSKYNKSDSSSSDSSSSESD